MATTGTEIQKRVRKLRKFIRHAFSRKDVSEQQQRLPENRCNGFAPTPSEDDRSDR